jgi:hypothetical protein
MRVKKIKGAHRHSQAPSTIQQISCNTRSENKSKLAGPVFSKGELQNSLKQKESNYKYKNGHQH